jgi:endonuclease/exonuclease/phosphatase family metal-dependent hydrolase
VRLRVLTYNIHRAIGLDRRFRLDRIADILYHHDADLVLLQEVDDGARRSKRLDLAKKLAQLVDYPHYAVGHNVRLRSGRYGNATLSRFKIERERNIDLTIGKRKRRGCQHTTLRVEKRPGHPHRIEVFNLHLGLSPKERTQQVGRLVKSDEFKSLTPERPCIVAGDFNDWRSMLHPIFTQILDFHCATQGDEELNGAIRTFPSFSPTAGLDRLYYRGLRVVHARRCRLRTSRVASDHLPVIVDLELT